MTEKEMHKLSRAELLELLLEERKLNDELNVKLDELTASLENRRIDIEESGTMADAAMRLAGVYEAADKAAALYQENAKSAMEDSYKVLEDARQEGYRIVLQANAEADGIKTAATAEGEKILAEAKSRADALSADASMRADSLVAEAGRRAESIIAEAKASVAPETPVDTAKEEEQCQKKEKSLFARLRRK